jgi:hypothetical protein
MWQRTDKKKKNGKAIMLMNYPAPGVQAKHLLRDCGQCSGCRIRRRMDLALRLQHEAHFHEHTWFVTLTYDDEHLPAGGTLVADHITKFIKNLRNGLRKTKEKTRFFGVGEYGGEEGRPHYHVILFGPRLDDRTIAYTKPNKQFYSPQFVKMFGKESNNEYYESETLNKAWGDKGFVQVTSVSEATMQYVAKYHIDKVTGDKAEEHYQATTIDGQIIQRQPETARMSGKPGLGKKWIEKYWTDVYPDGFIISSGTKHAPPKYYDRWLEEHHPEMYADLKERREKNRDVMLDLDERRAAINEIRNAQMTTPRQIGKGPYHGR